MPYITEWQPNELFLEHNGVRVFHTYKNDETEIRTYWYGTASDTRDVDDDTSFDVRDLPTWKLLKALLKGLVPETENKNRYLDAIRNTIIAAIDTGHLKRYIEAAEGRPKEPPDSSIKANCFVGLSFDGESWNMEINCTSVRIRIPITAEQQADLEDAGITQ